jgi:hypothetical protein
MCHKCRILNCSMCGVGTVAKYLDADLLCPCCVGKVGTDPATRALAHAVAVHGQWVATSADPAALEARAAAVTAQLHGGGMAMEYNQLLRIEEDLGDIASYPGRQAFYNLK